MKRMVTAFDLETGEILSSGETSREDLRPNWVVGEFDGSKYWINPETRRANLRRPFPVKASANRIAGLPEGTLAIEGGDQFDVAGGAVVYQPSDGLEQEIGLELRHPRFLPATVKVPIGPATVSPGEGETARPLQQDYRELRQYPDDREQIGALVKAVKALMAGEPVPEEALAVIAEVDAAKVRWPKPAEIISETKQEN